MRDKERMHDEMDMPLGLSMAVSQNPWLFDMFSSLSSEQKSSLIGREQPKHEKHDGIISGDAVYGFKKLEDYHSFD